LPFIQFSNHPDRRQQTRFEVRLDDETVWDSQKMLFELYQTTKQNISVRIQNIFEKE
jgi:hypothetical protein